MKNIDIRNLPSLRPLFAATLLGASLLGACDQIEGDNADLAELAAESEGDELVGPDALVDEEAEPVPAGALPRPEGLTDASHDPVAITGAQKVCSVYQPGVWRDTLVVPQNWTASSCNEFRATTGTSNYQLACLSDTWIYWGAGGAFVPWYNPCGW